MKMKAAQISKAKGDWELVERDIPEPGPGQVRVKIDACGICHSDALVKEGLWPGLQYPRIPGHEVAGRIDAVGENVTAWEAGQRVGVGWHGGHCFVCEPCRRGDFAMCINRKVTGLDFDGGYAEYMIAPAPALAAIPEELPAEEAGPFMCAGVTVYNALRNSGAPGTAGCRSRHRRSWTFRRSVRAADGLQDGGDQPRQRQRTPGSTTRRASLHRLRRH